MQCKAKMLYAYCVCWFFLFSISFSSFCWPCDFRVGASNNTTTSNQKLKECASELVAGLAARLRAGCVGFFLHRLWVYGFGRSVNWWIGGGAESKVEELRSVHIHIFLSRFLPHYCFILILIFSLIFSLVFPLVFSLTALFTAFKQLGIRASCLDGHPSPSSSTR